jgi:hypothetical protein
MIIRLVTYHALPGKDVEGWLKGIAAELRGVSGMQNVEFVRSESDPSKWGALMSFKTKEDLNNYKATGPYQKLVKSLRETWLDEAEPVNDQVFEVAEI